MSESPAVYRAAHPAPLKPKALSARRCCLPYSDHRYRSPTAHEIESLISIAGWSQTEFADIVGVSTSSRGSSTIRRWKCDPLSDSYREIPYAAWRLALFESGLISLEDNTFSSQKI